MANGAEDMGLATVFVDGVAHRFAVDGQAFVGFSMDGVPTLQGPIQALRIDADQHIANDRFAGDLIAAMAVAAAIESGPGTATTSRPTDCRRTLESTITTTVGTGQTRSVWY